MISLQRFNFAVTGIRGKISTINKSNQLFISCIPELFIARLFAGDPYTTSLKEIFLMLKRS